MASHDERVNRLYTFLKRARRLADLFGIPIQIAMRVVRHVAILRKQAGVDDDNPL